MHIQQSTIPLYIATGLLLLYSCNEEYVPKPRGYFRIDLPQHTYQYFNVNSCPFAFEHHVMALVTPDIGRLSEPCWFNIVYPLCNATVHISYKKIDKNLNTYIEDARTLAYKHTIKATDITEIPVRRDSARVFGLIYLLEGNTASSVQFYLTDSTFHFVRSALYFNAVTNADSLTPVVSYLKRDIEKMIASFFWK